MTFVKNATGSPIVSYLCNGRQNKGGDDLRNDIVRKEK
jgi:hypothetical protein